MSSNKKQKLDFKDALKAKGARPASEAAVVEVHGVPTTIIRGDMSDSAWSQIKARELPEKAIQRYEETGSLPSPKPSGKMTTVPDDGAGGPRADASLDDTQRSEHVEEAPNMGMAISARNPAGIIPQLATGATPQDVSKVPTDLANVDTGMTPAEAMAPTAPVETVTTPTGDVIEKPPPQPGVRTLEPMTMDAGGPPPEEPFKLPSVEEGTTSLAQAQIKALQGAQAVAEQQAKSEQALRQQHAVEFAQEQLHEKQRQDAYNAKMDEYERSSIDIRNQMLENAKASVDPNRYWANKDAGQKAAAVIAGALFGFTGQGMQWLQRLDGLVAQDIQAQAADIANRGNMLQAAAGQNRNLIGELRARGVDGAAAYHSAMGMMKENLANQIEIMKLNTSSQSARAVMDEKIAQIQADAAKDLEKGRQVQSTHALDAQLKMAQIQKLRAETADIGKPPAPKQLDANTIKALAEGEAALKSAKNLSAEFKANASGFWAKAAAWDPTSSTDAAQYNQKRLVVLQTIGRMLEGGVLKEADIVRYNAMMPKAGTMGGEVAWDSIINDLSTKLSAQKAGLKASGYNTEGVESIGSTLANQRKITETPAPKGK